MILTIISVRLKYTIIVKETTKADVLVSLLVAHSHDAKELFMTVCCLIYNPLIVVITDVFTYCKEPIFIYNLQKWNDKRVGFRLAKNIKVLLNCYFYSRNYFISLNMFRVFLKC